MLRSLFAGVSGLRNHQFRMDVIGNNIANVNTVAFKSGRVTFKEGFAQLLQGASRPPGDQGGANPVQIGLGSQIGSVDQLFTQGNVETTGVNTDMAMQGNAFFVVRKGGETYFTRSGNFQLDANGRMVSPTNGFIVQGRMAQDGIMNDAITDITLPFGQKVAARATTRVTVAGNLNSSVGVFNTADPDGAGPLVGGFGPDTRAVTLNNGTFTNGTIGMYDALGNKLDVKMWMWKTAANTWDWQVDSDTLPAGYSLGADTPGATGVRGQFTFDPASALLTQSAIIGGPSAGTGVASPTITINGPGGASVSVTVDLGAEVAGSGVAGSLGGLTQFSGNATAVLRDQDGYQSGQLQNFSIDRAGVISGAFTNGVNQTLGQIVFADFNNPAGLLRTGDNMYAVSGNSGGAVYGYALAGSQSFVTSGALEMSNVDLAQEFTSLIVAQRGFQANGRVITTSDTMLEELVNLKREAGVLADAGDASTSASAQDPPSVARQFQTADAATLADLQGSIRGGDSRPGMRKSLINRYLRPRRLAHSVWHIQCFLIRCGLERRSHSDAHRHGRRRTRPR
jgi:flagellar hook protein FlgE